MKHPVRPLPVTLALASVCLVFCQCSLGSRPASFPQWQQVSTGITAESDVILVAISPHDPQTMHMGTYDPGGLYCSFDAGLSWQRCNEGLETLTVLSLAYNPRERSALLAGTVSGPYASADGGKTWAPVAGLSARYVYALAWAAKDGAVYAGTEGHGVYVSTDEGRTWRNVGPEGTSILSLAVAPDGITYAGSAGQGLWVSDDGGAQWRRASTVPNEAFVSALSVTDGGTVWLLADGSLYSSADGETWRKTGPTEFRARTMAIAPRTGQFIYAGGLDAEIAVSADEGITWDLVPVESWDMEATCLAVDPVEPHTAFLGTKGSGLFKTGNGGQTWSPSSDEVGKRVVAALVQNPLRRRTFYAGTIHGVYRSTDGAGNWALVSGEAGELYVQALAVDPEDGQTIYAGSQSGVYISRDGGEEWEWASRGLGHITVFCLTAAPDDGHTVYAGSWGNNVLRTVDGGRSWAPLHSGLETLSVYSLAVNPANPRVLYAGTVEAIYRSIDGGESWQALEGLRQGLTTFALLFDPADASSLYAGTTDGVYQSPDDGETWVSRRQGMGSVTVNALAADAARGTVYAGTEQRGLFRSADFGARWTPWGFEGKSVYALVTDQLSGELLVATEEGVFKCIR